MSTTLNRLVEDRALAERLLRMADACDGDGEHWRVLSSEIGARNAMAMAMAAGDGYTMIDAIDRVGEDWLRALILAGKKRRDRA